ncbi:T9SS type A sorting domain-containing protein [Marivirga sp.]|uniref:T9SS type A sorting domain-containing protein n=1 Tax=Marivirga sp. TaxID=2018662 RepID=UPI002D7E904F|nr:T9SS type A sorting domain-containing protein [Marivirga sp.]HET8860780.1 T9SS type A sorting domain-containing protein [Marivirga sp.]
MKKILFLLVASIIYLPFKTQAQFTLSETSYSGAEIVSGINACNCKEVIIPTGLAVNMEDSWDLTSFSNLILRIEGSGQLIFSGSGNNRDELLMSESSFLLIDDTNNTSALSSGNNGNVFISIGTGTYQGKDFQDIIAAGGADSVNDGTLPIELKSFSASKSGKNIDLDWVTAKEENFSHFEIERSIDQKNWEQIGLVQGMGDSMSDVKYDFTDRSVPFGVIYYRLKSVDIDASYEFSPVVTIEVGFEGKLAVSPNPVQDASNLKIQVPSDFREQLAYVGLFDLSGIKVQEFRNFNTDGTLQINQQLKAGMYILKVNHNGLQENIRVIVQ